MMMEFSNYALYDENRTLRLSLEPIGQKELLESMPGELIITHPLLAARLGRELVADEELLERRDELDALDEDSALRIWLTTLPSLDGRTIFLSAPDGLADTDGAPDWSITCAGFLVGSVEKLCDWVKRVSEADDPDAIRYVLSAIFSDTMESPHAVKLTDLTTQKVLQIWPIRFGNPIPALSAAAKAWPTVRYTEEDFTFTLKKDLVSKNASHDNIRGLP